MTWSRDDNILFTLEEESLQSIWRIPSNGGTPEQLGVSINGEIRGPAMHPDGQSLYFTVGRPHKRDLGSPEFPTKVVFPRSRNLNL
jgi:hypothetical protein